MSILECIQKISEIIDNEIAVHKTLFQFLLNQQKYIVDGKIREMQESFQEQEEILTEIASFEYQRNQEVKNLAQEIGRKEKELKMDTLISLLDDDVSERLKNQKIEFKSIVQDILQINKLNQFLVENALEFLGKQIDIFMGIDDDSRLYYKAGKPAAHRDQARKLVDHRI